MLESQKKRRDDNIRMVFTFRYGIFHCIQSIPEKIKFPVHYVTVDG